jgi:hypothetical protein
VGIGDLSGGSARRKQGSETGEQFKPLARTGLSQLLDTLAAALGKKTKRFSKTVETAKQALNLPATQNDKPLAEAIQSRLKRYKANKPCRENCSVFGIFVCSQVGQEAGAGKYQTFAMACDLIRP